MGKRQPWLFAPPRGGQGGFRRPRFISSNPIKIRGFNFNRVFLRWGLDYFLILGLFEEVNVLWGFFFTTFALVSEGKGV